MTSLWDYYRKTEEERIRIHNDYHLNRINEALTNLRGHYYKIPVKYVKGEQDV
jgi:hypothetical protein